MAPMPATTEMVNRLQPKSSLMGMTKIPKLLRDPVLTKAMKVTAATTYQPKYRGDLAVDGSFTKLSYFSLLGIAQIKLIPPTM